MKKMLDFVKTTILGGLVAIVPIAVLLVSLGMVLGILIDITTAMADVLPYSAVASTTIIFGVALVALAGI